MSQKPPTDDATLSAYLQWYADHPEKFLSLLPAGEATPAMEVLDRILALLDGFDAPVRPDPERGAHG